MKHFLFIVFVALSSIRVYSQEVLYLYQYSGGIISFAFVEKPVLKFDNNLVVLETSNCRLEYQMVDIRAISFTKESTAIEEVKEDSSSEEDTDGKVYVYTTGGILLKSFPSSSTFSLSDLKTGIYIIKKGKVTYKIVKK